VIGVTDSILNMTKKVLGVAEDDDSFDIDIIMHINTVFTTLHQLGIGPVDGFMIEDDTKKWEDYTTGDANLNAVKSYVYLRVRLLHDPPSTSFAIDSMQKQIVELEWRLNVYREGKLYPYVD